MVAKIAGFVSRADAGLRPPRSVSRNITPDRGGVAVHHGGGRQSAAEPGADHSLCIQTWRNWQNFHMNTHGWVDLAYTGGFCNHGFAFAGRGQGVRTAANGTNVGNQNYNAVVWIGGLGQEPTELALDALDWWFESLRGSGSGRGVKPHSFFRNTGCPIPELRAFGGSRDGKDIPTTSAPTPKPSAPSSPAPTTLDQVRSIQTAVKVAVDGKWGPKTDLRVMTLRNAAFSRSGFPTNRRASFNTREVQGVISTNVDGLWGPLSQAALIGWIKKFQKILNVKADGLWGPKTDGKLLALRRKHLNRF